MKRPLIICLLAALRFAVHAQGVITPGKYSAGDFSVADCFKNFRFVGAVAQDSVAASHIMKGQQIWRTISLESGQNNTILNTNRDCAQVGLFEIIKFGLFEKKLNAFSSDDFNHAEKSRLSKEQLLQLLMFKDTSAAVSFDAEGNELLTHNAINRYLMGSDIKTYLLKEDWITNSYSGKTEKYVVAIAPLLYDKEAQKNRPVFWLYYPEWKELFASFEAANFYSHNRISFNDVFIKKQFESRISKETNIFDRGVKSVNHGEDAYLESERIKERFMNSESDLFQY